MRELPFIVELTAGQSVHAAIANIVQAASVAALAVLKGKERARGRLAIKIANLRGSPTMKRFFSNLVRTAAKYRQPQSSILNINSRENRKNSVK
jgi:hypothetical protein